MYTHDVARESAGMGRACKQRTAKVFLCIKIRSFVQLHTSLARQRPFTAGQAAFLSKSWHLVETHFVRLRQN